MSANFPFVEAEYRTETIPMYVGNPYIEALPALPDDRSLARELTHLPEFSQAERQLPPSVRIQMLDKLRHVFVALPRVVRLARGMLKMLHSGYGPRRPFSHSDNETLARLYKSQQVGAFKSLRQTHLAAQHSMALIGGSGQGKSFALRQIAGLLPPVIHHPKHGKWQLPFIFLEMAYDGQSTHSLASGVAGELDRLLPDGRYSETYLERKGLNAEQRLAKMFKVAYEHGVGMVIVDETQNQRSLGNESPKDQRRKASSMAARVETPLTKLLITTSNTSHMPLLFAGTPEMYNIVGTRFTRARRMAGRGSSEWGALPRSAPGSLGEFELLLKALFRYQWVQNPIEYSDEWANTLHAFTQGIPDILVKLWEAVQEAAISSNKEAITEDLVVAVFGREFFATEFGITALKNKDRLMLDVVSDLFTPEPDLLDYSMAQHRLPVAPEPLAQSVASRAGTKSRPTSKASTSVKASPEAATEPVPAKLDPAVVAEADLRAAAVPKSTNPDASAAAVEVADLTAELGQ